MGFYCLSKKGNLPPTVEHDTLDEAEAEAIRLHKLDAGVVQILKKVGEVKTEKVIIVSGNAGDDFIRINKNDGE